MLTLEELRADAESGAVDLRRLRPAARPRDAAQASYMNAATFVVDGGLTAAYVTPE